MSVVGIIAEYNPFHKGHLYHLENTRKLTEASACVCVLSSNFVQRGEPAIINKWARTKMALASGADLVIELPTAFSCGSAEYFASGAISLLEGLNCVDYLSFGSEEGSLEILENIADILSFESGEFKRILKSELDKGLGFATARQKALNAFVPGCHGSIIDKPNNILAIEYIKAMKRFGSSIKPFTVERMGQGYKSLALSDSYSSASAIRKYFFENLKQNADISKDTYLLNNLPKSSIEALSEEYATGRGPLFLQTFESIIFHLLRSIPEGDLSKISYVSEGLENRFKKASQTAATLEELISAVVTNRYPISRIKRILCGLLTGITSEFLEELKYKGYAQYVKILGFNDTGRKLLSDIRKKALLPIVTKPADYHRLVDPLGIKLFEHEIRTTDIYVLGYPNPLEWAGSSELTTTPIYFKM